MEHPTTPNSPIDLAGDIHKLLETILKGREELRSIEARNIFEAWRVAKEDYDFACNELTELVGRRSPSLEKIALQNEVKTDLGKKHVESWHKVKELTSFVVRFGDSVEVLLRRLPNDPMWQRFPELIRDLRFRSVEAWTQPIANPDLDTLEMRLCEMRAQLEQGQLSDRDSEIERAIIQKLGRNCFEHHHNPEIISESLRILRARVDPKLTESKLRASLIRIRKGRGYRSSESIHEQRRTKN